MNAVIDPLHRAATRPSTIQIVPFTREYLFGALVVAREIHAHSIYRDMPLDEEKLVRQLVGSGQEFPDRYFRLAVRGPVVLGGFYGCVFRTFFCDEMLAKDMGWWVTEDARGGLAAIKLLADFEGWAKEKGARKCMIGQSGVENIETTAKLFMHCGYTFTGYNTAKDL